MLDPVTSVDEKSTNPARIEDWKLATSMKGRHLFPQIHGLLIGSAGASLPCGLLQPEKDTIWFDTGVSQTNQWPELRAMWLMVANEAPPLIICTDS